MSKEDLEKYIKTKEVGDHIVWSSYEGHLESYMDILSDNGIKIISVVYKGTSDDDSAMYTIISVKVYK